MKENTGDYLSQIEKGEGYDLKKQFTKDEILMTNEKSLVVTEKFK